MPTRDEMDAAIANLKGDIADAGTRIAAAITALQAKIDAGQDFSSELETLKGESDAVKALGT